MKQSTRDRGKSLWLTPVIFLLSACIVGPVQTVRLPQIEIFEQSYVFESLDQADSVFQKILGEKNWAILRDYGLSREVIDDFLAGKIVLHGSLMFTLSLVPGDRDKFFVEGLGRYYIVRTTTGEIILSADYYIDNGSAGSIHSLHDLQQTNRLEVKIKQCLLRHVLPDKPNYFVEEPAQFRLYLQKTDDGRYGIDYGRDDHGLIIDGRPVGRLKFENSPLHNSKLLQLR